MGSGVLSTIALAVVDGSTAIIERGFDCTDNCFWYFHQILFGEIESMRAKWKTVTKSATALLLDAKNPRLAAITNQSSQLELVAALVNKEDIYPLAKSIAESGYFQSEVLVAVRESSKLIIIEGNCRLAASKLLISPEIAPANVQGKFRALANKADLSQLKAIPICIAPSREATYPLVLKRHTKLPISKWVPVMQAKFYRQLFA